MSSGFIKFIRTVRLGNFTPHHHGYAQGFRKRATTGSHFLPSLLGCHAAHGNTKPLGMLGSHTAIA